MSTPRPPVILDWETYFCTKTGYSLGYKKKTTSEYIMHDLFTAHCVGVYDLETGQKVIRWYDDIPALLDWLEMDKRTVACHNHFFDGAINYWRYGKLPLRMVCTQLMSFAVFGGLLKSHSLDSVSQHVSGSQQKQVGGLKKYDGVKFIIPSDRADMEHYLLHDLDATALIYNAMAPQFTELTWQQMDWSIRQFVDSKLRLNVPRLKMYQQEMVEDEAKLWQTIGIPKTEFTSSQKFSKLVESYGHEAPVKWSEKQEKNIPALAKNDEGFIDMLSSEHKVVRNLARLRQHAQSNIEMTRCVSLLKHGNITPNKRWPLHVQFSGAKMTHRLSGSDGAGGNPLNLPRGSELRKCIEPLFGCEFYVADQSKFELCIARTLAGDMPALSIIHGGGDPYCDFSSAMYQREITKADKDERQVGKTAQLQLQYGSGAKTLRGMLLAVGVVIPIEEAQRVVDFFRYEKHRPVYDYWQWLRVHIFPVLIHGTNGGPPVPLLNAPFLTAEKGRINLPSGLALTYPDLHYQQTERGNQLMFRNFSKEKGEWDNLYPAKLYQHCCQSLANEVMMLHKYNLDDAGHEPVMEVYDEVACILTGLVHDDVDHQDRQNQIADINRIMETSPPWWPELRLKVDGDTASNYGEAK